MSLFSRFVCCDNSYLFTKSPHGNKKFQSIKSIQIFDKRAIMCRLVTYANVLKYLLHVRYLDRGISLSNEVIKSMEVGQKC